MDEDIQPVTKKAKSAAEETEVLDADTIAMNKASMKRKDRHLYQSILNRQAAKRQKITKLQQKRTALSKAKT